MCFTLTSCVHNLPKNQKIFKHSFNSLKCFQQEVCFTLFRSQVFYLKLLQLICKSLSHTHTQRERGRGRKERDKGHAVQRFNVVVLATWPANKQSVNTRLGQAKAPIAPINTLLSFGFVKSANNKAEGKGAGAGFRGICMQGPLLYSYLALPAPLPALPLTFLLAAACLLCPCPLSRLPLIYI